MHHGKRSPNRAVRRQLFGGNKRDEQSQLPYRCVYPHNGPMRRYRIADKERGALRRVAAICKALGAHFYHQTDPRGCALYVSAEPIKDNDYTRGIACCVS